MVEKEVDGADAEGRERGGPLEGQGAGSGEAPIPRGEGGETALRIRRGKIRYIFAFYLKKNQSRVAQEKRPPG